MNHSLIKVGREHSGKNKWCEVYENLMYELTKGDYSKGDKFFSIAAVCEKFSVSSITARRALSELSRQKLIIQRQGIGSVVNCKHKNRDELAFFVPAKVRYGLGVDSNTIRFAIMSGVIERASREGIEVKHVDENSIADDITKVVLIHHACYEFDKESFRKTCANSIPIILHTHRRIEGFYTVRHGLYEGAYLATKHLIEKGYRKIAFISGPLSEQWFVARLQGYLEALNEGGISFKRNFLKETSGRDKLEDVKAFKELGNGPDAIFCGNDTRALNILEYCSEKKIRVPEDIAICGFDNISQSKISNPPLTTIDTHLKKLGESAVELAVKIMDEEITEVRDVVVAPELVIRETT